MKPYQDGNDRRNGPAYQTGRPCIETGCNRPAGTKWSPLWCFECNVARMDRISASFARVADALNIQDSEGKE